MKHLQGKLITNHPPKMFIIFSFLRFISINNLDLAKGDIARLTEYTGRYDTAARKGTSRAKFKIKQELTTPYGNLAGSAIRLGDRRRYNATAVAV